jgi:3-deoxy-D-manno-octulosonic-acid transferase
VRAPADLLPGRSGPAERPAGEVEPVAGRPSAPRRRAGRGQIARLGRLQLELLEPAEEAQAELLDAVIVDRLGLLYRLYAGAAAAYVGGAFRGALHNVMEPAAFGVPVVTGPRIRKSWVAGEMLRAGGLFPIADVPAAVAVLEHLLAGEPGARAGERARSLLLTHSGAAERTLRALEEVGWLPQSGTEAAIPPES